MSLFSIDRTDLHYSMELCFAGAACALRTNSSDLARALEGLSISTGDAVSHGFEMRVVVDESSDEAVGSLIFEGCTTS